MAKIEGCADAETFYAELRRGQEATMSALIKASHKAPLEITRAFERLGTHQRRRRILELLLWPVLDKPALPSQADSLPDFVWQFQVPVVVTLALECLDRTTVLGATGLDVDAIGAALVESNGLRDMNMLACWPSLYRREDFYAYGPLQLAQRMVDLFKAGEADVLQPLPIVLDPEIPHARVVTLHIWAGAQMSVGTTELLSREPLEASTRQDIERSVVSFLCSQGAEAESVEVLDPQHMVEGYFTNAPSWQRELQQTLRLASAAFAPGEVRLQLPAPGFFELLAEDRSILLPPTAVAVPRLALKQDVTAAVEAAGLKLAGSFSPAIQVSGLMH